MSDQQTRTVIVALPEGTSPTWWRVAQILAWVKLPAHVPVTVFPVRRSGLRGWISRWLSRHLLDAVRSHGAVTHAAGGQVSRLDLTGLATSTRLAATARWQLWNWQIARNTPVARTWEQMLADNDKQDPKKRLSSDELREQFDQQPRILAMLAFNSYPAAPYQWDLDDLAAFQAGEAVYVALHWQEALVGDAVITPRGELIEPASSSLADRLRYLADATRVIHDLTPRQHLVAVKAAPAPLP